MKMVWKSLAAIGSLTVVASSFALENADLAGTWNLSGPLVSRVKRIHGEALRATGAMTFNLDGTCSLAISTSVGLNLPPQEGCSGEICLPCTYTVSPGRRFDINWDDEMVSSVANGLGSNLLGNLTTSSNVDIEVEQSNGILRPNAGPNGGRLRVNTRIKGFVTSPDLTGQRRFILAFTMAGPKQPVL